MCWSTGIILIVTRPATIIKSLCRGLQSMASAPKRARSNRLDAVAMSSIPQHAVANGIGQSDDRRAQFTAFFSCSVSRLSGRSCVSMHVLQKADCEIIVRSRGGSHGSMGPQVEDGGITTKRRRHEEPRRGIQAFFFGAL